MVVYNQPMKVVYNQPMKVESKRSVSGKKSGRKVKFCCVVLTNFVVLTKFDTKISSKKLKIRKVNKSKFCVDKFLNHKNFNSIFRLIKKSTEIFKVDKS